MLLHVVVFAYSMYLRVRTDEFGCSQFDFTNTTWPHLYLSRACVCGCCTGKNVRKALFSALGFLLRQMRAQKFTLKICIENRRIIERERLDFLCLLF